MISEIKFPDVAARVESPDACGPAEAPQAPMFEGYGDMLTVDDLSKILGVSRKAVQMQCRRGDLPAVSIGRRWYVAKNRLVDFVMGGE